MVSIKKILYVLFGSITLVLGVIGIFVPLLPTTPFLLLTAFFYMRSSDKLHNWLMTHKKFGPYIKGIVTDKAMSKKAKQRSLITLWMTISISIYTVPLVLAKVTLIVIASSVSLYIFQLKTSI